MASKLRRTGLFGKGCFGLARFGFWYAKEEFTISVSVISEIVKSSMTFGEDVITPQVLTELNIPSSTPPALRFKTRVEV